MKYVVKVAFNIGLYRQFDYLPPIGLTTKDCNIGSRILAPFGNRKLIGVVVGCGKSDLKKLRIATSLLDKAPIFEKYFLDWLHWAAWYYCYPIGEVFGTALPALLRRQFDSNPLLIKKWKLTTIAKASSFNKLKLTEPQKTALELINTLGDIHEQFLVKRKIHTSTLASLKRKQLLDYTEDYPYLTKPDKPVSALNVLNNEQQKAFEFINKKLNKFAVIALNGITGSGKTEVYLHLIKEIISQGKTAMVLVPEIGLTPQTVTRFKSLISTRVIVIHSSMDEKERLHAWYIAQQEGSGLVIGTRSALFTPLPRLALIIIDEEHDSSYKQHTGFRYHARDLAIKQAHERDFPVVLGSATLSLETLYNIERERYFEVKLCSRPIAIKPISINLISMQGVHEPLHKETLEVIKRHIDDNNQVLVFINRRGYSPSLYCCNCMWKATCNKCDLNMVLHQNPVQLKCHSCNLISKLPISCPNCLSNTLISVGSGSQKIEQKLQTCFKKVIRVDRDSMKSKNAFDNLLADLNNNMSAVLVGTQMLAKGHDFHNLTLVVVVDADSGLFCADFKGSEKTAQTILQVIGRAGRGNKPGEAIIQTQLPEHPIMKLLVTNNYSEISTKILQERKSLLQPPYVYMAVVLAESIIDKNSYTFLDRIVQNITKPDGINMFGPSQPIRAKINSMYRWQLIITSKNRGLRQQFIHDIITLNQKLKQINQLRWHINVDPVDMY